MQPTAKQLRPLGCHELPAIQGLEQVIKAPDAASRLCANRDEIRGYRACEFSRQHRIRKPYSYIMCALSRKAGDPSKSSARLGYKKRLVFTLALLFLVWLVCDTAGYFLLRWVGSQYRIFWDDAALPSRAHIEAFAEQSYHPRLGWDIPHRKKGPLGGRASRPYQKDSIMKIKAFGDSFTFCEDVEDDQTWTHAIEEKTGWDCPNFGVPGYGTDQALLKYLDSEVPSEYTVLGIFDEDIARLMIRFKAFYQRESAVATKPRFRFAEDGSLALVENPFPRAAELEKLRDRNFLESVKATDYWAGYYSRKGAPPRLLWPATRTVVGHLPFFWEYGKVFLSNKLSPSLESRKAVWKYHHLYEPGSDGLRLMNAIVDEFVKTAHARREHPIVIIFPNFDSVALQVEFGHCPYETLRTHLSDIGVTRMDLADVFIGTHYEQYYLPSNGRHLNPAGNRLVAEKVIELIQQLDTAEPLSR
jgi:hypothetical protein